MSLPVLVVNPWITDFKLYDEWMHPAGLYMLIDLLNFNDIPVIYFNCLERNRTDRARKYGTGTFTFQETVRPPSLHSIKRKYKRYGCTEETLREFCASVPEISTVFVGSMMTYWAEGVVQTVRVLQQEFAGVPVVIGGIAAQLIPDYFRKQLPTVVLHNRALPVTGENATFPGIPEKLRPPPEYSLLNGLRHADRVPHGPVLASLGCPMRCSYCASALLQKRFYRRSTELVENEIDEMRTRWSVADFAFYDDALLVDAEAGLLPLLQKIIDSGWRIRIHTPNGLHLKYCSESLLTLMKAAGFTTLRFGYESGLSKNRSLTGGKADEYLLRSMLHFIQMLDFSDTGVYVMGGLPDSTPEEMADEMKTVAGFGVKVKPVFLSPVPGTALFNRYINDFPLLAEDPHWHNDTFFITKLPGWGGEAVEEVRRLARSLNAVG